VPSEDFVNVKYIYEEQMVIITFFSKFIVWVEFHEKCLICLGFFETVELMKFMKLLLLKIKAL